MALRIRNGALAVALLFPTACAAPARGTAEFALLPPSESSTADGGGSCGQAWTAEIDADARGAPSPEALLEEQRDRAAGRLADAEAAGDEWQVAWAGLRLRLYTELLRQPTGIGSTETATPLGVPGLGSVDLMRLNDGTWAQHEETLMGGPC